MNPDLRARFDALVERVVETLPEPVLAIFDEVPLIVDDRPDRALVRKLAVDFDIPDDPEEHEQFAMELCGLHSGRMITERSVEDPSDVPEDIRIYREGIVGIAGGWEQDLTAEEIDRLVEEQIRVTILHEVGHHFGLEEEDLEELGYD
ncbi:MAG: metallopeptidase family protein [Phycisphaerales bacterium]|jgi:predicted Zn-dependent protease with MMP-like domain